MMLNEILYFTKVVKQMYNMLRVFYGKIKHGLM